MATPTHEQRARIAEEADDQQNEIVASVLASGFSIDWSAVEREAANADDPLKGIRAAVNRQLASRDFRETIQALDVNGRLLAAFTQQRHEELAGFRLPAALTFREPPKPDVFTPERAVAYWRKKLKLTDKEAADLLAAIGRGESPLLGLRERITKSLMERILSLFEAAISEGIPERDFARKLRELPTPKGWSGGLEDVTNAVIETEYRTNLTEAYSEAASEIVIERAATFPFRQFMAIRDSRVTWWCCGAMGTAGPDGRGYIVATTDDLSHTTWRLPAHYRCFVPETEVEGRFDLAMRMSYAGEVVELKTRGGRKITVTPNHPIATPGGFVAAGEIRKDDHVISRAAQVEPLCTVGATKEKQDSPSRIDEVWRAFLHAGGRVRRARLTHQDLHGDAAMGDGEIEVVAIDGVLLHETDAASAKLSGQLVFELPAPSAVNHLADSLRAGFVIGKGAPPHGLPRGGALAADEAAVLFHSGPLQFLGFGSTAELDAMCAEATFHGFVGDPKFFAYLVGTLSAGVPPRNLSAVDANNQSPVGLMDAGKFQPGVDSLCVDPELPGDLRDVRPPLVFADEVTRVNRKRFVGHVYDLRSATGLIIANGVLASNCRSAWSPISYLEARRMGILARDGRTKIAIVGGNPDRPYGDPPEFATHPETGETRRVEPQEGFGA